MPSFLSVSLVAVLVLVEIAVLVPVIITQKKHDEGLKKARLQEITDDYADRVNRSIATFVYNVVRAAASASTAEFLSQATLQEAVRPEEDPRNTPATLYFWVPFVPVGDRDEYERFYGRNITCYENNTVQPCGLTGQTLFAPITVFVPPLSASQESLPMTSGFDLLSFAGASVFRNATKYLIAPAALLPSGLVNRMENNYGFIAVAKNTQNKGYMFGRTSSLALLEFSLIFPRQCVTLAAFVLSANASRQALFYDESLGNVTNVAIFDALPLRSRFFVSSFSTLGEVFLIAVLYDESYASAFAGTTWIIVAAVLAPVCFLIDVIWIILAFFWERRRKQLLLEQRKRKEAQMMISYVNHEIRNPLQTILGVADLQVERAEEEGLLDLSSDWKTVIHAAEFVEHIARDILDLRRVEEGKLDIELSDVDVHALLKGVQKAAVPLLAQKANVDFKVTVECEIQSIRTDHYRLEQILLNFLTNAFKHTEKGVITLSVSCPSHSWVRISVWDTGKGIAPEKKEQLFRQFAQVSTKDASDLGGFGLGLFLTKMLAQVLGGRVGFDSTLGLGSVFWVELPVPGDETIVEQFEESELRLERQRF